MGSLYYIIQRLSKKEETFELRNGKLVGILDNKRIITENLGDSKINDNIVVSTNGIKSQYVIDDIISKRDCLGLGYWEVHIVEELVYKNKERKNRISWSVGLLFRYIGEFMGGLSPK